MSAAGKTAYNVLAALEDVEEVDEDAIEKVPEDEELRRQREAREEQRRKAAALKAEIQQKEASKATQVPPKIILPVELIRRTRMCDDWLQYGRCSSGTDCAFAHDVQEMHHNRDRVRAYQAEQYRKMGYTEYAKKLSGAVERHQGGHHAVMRDLTGGEPARPAAAARPASAGKQAGADKFRTQLCRNYLSGRCYFGDRCTFAHGEEELRQYLGDEAAVQQELARWGLGSGASSSGQAYGYDQGSSYGYGDAPYYGAGASTPAGAAGGYAYGTPAGGYAQPPPPPPPPRAAGQPAAAQQSVAGAAGPREVNAAQLELLMEGLDFTEEEEHAAFLCPITHERLRDPVVAADGFTYERAAIQNWLSTRDTSPMTNDPLEDKVLIPNITLIQAMRVVLGKNWDQYR